MPAGNVGRRAVSAKPVRPRGSPPTLVASRVTVPAIVSAMRRHANVQTMRYAALQPLHFPDA